MSSTENEAEETGMSTDSSNDDTLHEEASVNKVVDSNCVNQEAAGSNSVPLPDYEIGEWKPENEGNNVAPETVRIRKIFVGNLPTRASARNLRELFSGFGKLIDVYIARNVFTEVRHHYGFVTFLNPDDAKRALEAGPFALFRRDLTVAPADLHHQPFETADGYIQWRHRKWALSETPVPLTSASGSNSTCSNENPVKVTPMEEEIDESQCFISNLNDDCLLQVFKYLSKMERIKIERVCKNWQRVSKMLWSDTKVLKIADVFDLRKNKFPDMINIDCLLSRCGKYLTNLDISAVTHRLCASVLSLIARQCTQLQHLNVSGIPVNKQALQKLGKYAGPRLLSLHMEFCHGVHDAEMVDLFRMCSSLEVVNVSRTREITGKCLSCLPALSLTTLMINDCINIRPALLIKSLKRLPKLKTLMINSCTSLTNYDITQIVEAVPHLTVFSMSKFLQFIHKSSVCSIHLLTNLVSLDVQLNPVFDDTVMENISRSCTSIRYLNITGCGNSITTSSSTSLTDAGIRSVLRIPGLEVLMMSYLGTVTDQALEAAANHTKLKHLECRGCPAFTDRGCSRLISGCGQLEHFDFCGCYRVTNATLQTALDTVKQRTNNTTLSLVVGGTSIEEDQSCRNVPLLNVSYADLCVPHLLTDFYDEDFIHMDDASEWDWYGQDFDFEFGFSGDSDDEYEVCDMYELLDEVDFDMQWAGCFN